MSRKLRPYALLAILTALNFLNYIDRYVLPAVQEMIKHEFHVSDRDLGWLTGAFFVCYMVAAPFVGYLGDRVPRRIIVAAGALLWSGATLLTAITVNYRELLLRHMVVGIGEASFVAVAPALIGDSFPEYRRGRMMAVFYMAIPMGTALGMILGGALSRYGWRMPFLVGAAPGVILGLLVLFLPEPPRGAADMLADTNERGTIRGLFHNKAYWTATLGMAAMTFGVGGLSYWMPTFLVRMRGMSVLNASILFGGFTLVTGFAATLFGGWLGDRMLRRTHTAYYKVSAIGLALGVPAMLAAIYLTGNAMYPSIFLAEFLLLVNTGPLNAAVVNSVSGRIRATAVAVNLFVIHLLGDASSPVLVGMISDKTGSLQLAFLAPVAAVAISVVILLAGAKYAPHLPQPGRATLVEEGVSG